MNWHEALMNIKRSVNPGNVIPAWFEAIENRIAELEHSGHATLLREVEKDKRIAELEDQLNRPVLKTEWQQAQDRIAELEAEIDRLQAIIDAL